MNSTEKTQVQSEHFDQGRLSSLAVISMETERLLKLKENKEIFYKEVIDAFVQKERCMDCIYKEVRLLNLKIKCTL